MNHLRAIALTVLAAASQVHGQIVLSLDVNLRTADTPAATQPGFSSFIMGGTGAQSTPVTRSYGPISVTLASVMGSGTGASATHEDRGRGVPVDGGAFSNGALLRDFAFSRDNANGGLDITIAGLTPSSFYRFTIWSYDNSSGGNRASDWSANGNLVISNYAFNGTVLPTNNAQYNFAFIALADIAGQVIVSGRRNPASVDAANPPVPNFGVFFNGLQIEVAAPQPVLTSQPAGSTNHVGDRVTFSGAANGAPPLDFQWLKGAVEIPGANAASLTLSNLAPADSGDYTLRVTNLYGTNFSSAATLLVLPDPAPNVPQGLASYWPLDDQFEDTLGRTTLADVYSHNDFKIVFNGVFFDLTPGPVNSAVPFNGIDQFGYREGGFPSYNLPAYTLAMWVNGNGAGQSDRRFFAETSSNSQNSVFSLGTHSTGANGTIRVLVRNPAGVALLDKHSTRTALDGAWHHVVWTESNGEGRLYIDGALDETAFEYTRGAFPVDTTTIGAVLRSAGGTNFFSGAVDEIAVWSRALSFTEVEQIRTSGIPAPTSDLPPTITLDPASQSVFTRGPVTFSFAANGASPLFPQWRKGGANLPAETNATLVIPNVAFADAGNYDVIVGNALGSATSQVATLTVTLRLSTTNLLIDFNNVGQESTVDTQTDFSSFTLDIANGAGPFTRTYGGAEVTLEGIGCSLQTRKRTVPSNIVDFTEEKLLTDFVFAADTAADQGLNLAVNFLDPNQSYAVSIWSFDSVSGGNRISDWLVNGNLVKDDYTFNGSVNLPTNNAQYQFTFPAVADAQGRILIQGRRSASATAANNLFINALQVTRRDLLVRSIQATATNTLHLTLNVISATAAHRVEQKTNVADTAWFDVPEAVFTTNGNALEIIIPTPDTGTRFYRVVEVP
ncbi:MAG TPA: LamG-like jellyroll fold domain-containing protein [Candidatus Limnocylindria bacterium]|nr:LamG-like jellyroll fold domain-containing protein [Candidatus Limnocylindria bacterium]